MENQIYRAPQSELESKEPEEVAELATRGSRFLAALLDGVISLVFSVPFMLLAGPSLGFIVGTTTRPGMLYMVVGTIYGFAVLMLVHGYLLYTNGQTVGKKVLKIKIVGLDGRKLPLPRLVGLRYLPISLVTFIPYIGQFLPLADVLFIFRNDRRCVHDLIAGTRVIQE